MSKAKKLTGVAVPLGALYTKDNCVIGEYADLIPFGDFCKKSGLNIIQLLPVNDTGTQSSPYSGLSAFALHPIYIRLQSIPEFKSLYESDKTFAKNFDSFVKAHKYSSRYDYDEILNSKNYFLREIYNQTETGKTGNPTEELKAFIKKNDWLKVYAVYKNLKWKYMQASWKSWNKADQKKSLEEIDSLWKDKTMKKDHLFYAWCQMIADRQFTEAADELHKNGLLLKGDMPILMNEDSCDAWAYPQYFNQNLRAGSPADGENPAGQNWGFPTYNWKNLKADDYGWWKERLKNASKYYDAYRLDHILGFFRIWAIPSEDCNALNGHTEPYSAINRSALYEMGFDDDRIRWLSQPHIPTGVVEDITWNHEKAHAILENFCNQIGSEELWLFKESIKGSQQIWNMTLSDTGFSQPLWSEEALNRIKAKLVEYWSNRTLLEIAKNKFVPMWTYGNSTSWQSLNEAEKTKLSKTFEEINLKNEKLWKKQADDIFTAITSEIKMVPCGEDLGVGIECVPKTMAAHNILGLRVVRWSRLWSEKNQPYVPFEAYTPLSVTTTSVHDSSTIRQWWKDEIEKEFSMENGDRLLSENQLLKQLDMTAIEEEDKENSKDRPARQKSTSSENLTFSPEIACSILKKCAESASIWYINPLQDYLYMNEKYWLESAEEERINVPGSVNRFNWTYRMPVSIEDLNKDKNLIEKILDISKR